ncbi:MAG: 4Fe-4S dicluster domain-containing protein, partial [Pseudomonadota bacterium]
GSQGLGEDKGIERRSFLKTMLGGGAILLAGAGIVVEKKAWASTIMLQDGRKIVLTKGVVVADKGLCSGCRTCEAVCSTANNSGLNSSQLVRLFVEKDYFACDYTPHTCHQCSDPICMEECPEGAIHIDKVHGTNARIIDESKCVGCEACVEACENRYGIPRPRFNPAKKVCIKCHLCYGEPECVKHCPLGALKIVRSETGILTGLPFIKER